MYYVYVLYSRKISKFYIGYTKDLNNRIEHHNLGLDRWSERGIPWKLVYFEKYENKQDALRREKFLKTGKGSKFVKARIAKEVTARV